MCRVDAQKLWSNDKALTAELAMTAVLHTHSRRLEYHPHVHVIVPGGGVTLLRAAEVIKGLKLEGEEKLGAEIIYKALSEPARIIATKPIGAAPEGTNLAELAAWTVVGNVLLNLDEILMKR